MKINWKIVGGGVICLSGAYLIVTSVLNTNTNMIVSGICFAIVGFIEIVSNIEKKDK